MTNRCPVHANPMPFDADYYANPYPVYEKLHTEGTVHRICTPDGAPAWLVIGYDEVMTCLIDRRFVRKRWYASPDFMGDAVLPAMVRHGNVIMEDPPEHTRLRRMMNHAFLPSRIELLRGHVQHEVDELLNAIAANGETNGRTADLMSALAVPLPVSVVADILGVPKPERPNFRGWANNAFGGTPEQAQASLTSLFEMVKDLVAERRVRPKEDFTSYLISATDAKGQHLVEHEVIGMVYFIILGGFDSTAGTIGNTMHALLQDKPLLQELKDNPELIPRALEELMRFVGPQQSGIRRFAAEDVELGGQQIKAGDTLILCLAAANRAPEKFPEPTSVDFSRRRGDHVAFGKGPHICPGADLARMEMSIAVTELLRRFPDLQLAVPPDKITWRTSYVLRVPMELPVKF